METGDLDAAARALEKALADIPARPARQELARPGEPDAPGVGRRPATASQGRRRATRTTSTRSCVLADFEMASGDAEQAFDRVLAVVKRTSGAERNMARLHLLDLFEVLPPDDERLKKARTQLTLLLF